MKILMVSAHFQLPHDSIPIGGVQQHISKVSEALRARGHEVMWTYPTDTTVVLNPEANYPSITKVKTQDGVDWADAVVGHDFCSWLNPGKPNIVVFHGWEGACPPHPQVVAWRQEIARAAGATIAVGAFIPKWYGHEVDEVIWGATDAPVGEELTTEANLAMWVGRLEPDTCCLEAIRSALRKGLHVEVYGDGSLRVPLEKMRDSIPGARVFLFGFTRHEDVLSNLARAHVVLPSGLLSLLEARVRGKPCVVVAPNPLKLDYWGMHPTPPVIEDAEGTVLNLQQCSSPELPSGFQRWALGQTWAKVAGIYEALLGRQA